MFRLEKKLYFFRVDRVIKVIRIMRVIWVVTRVFTINMITF
jgi:hypothetical protein